MKGDGGPARNGMPEISPAASMVKPSGNDPAIIVHVRVPLPPVACSCWLYAVATFPLGSDVVVIVGGAGRSMVSK